MNALLITLACLALALVLRVSDDLLRRFRIRSVGAKANARSGEMAKLDLEDSGSLDAALDYYKNLMD